ncbi:MAG: DUF504 domain-containing protein [Thermoplasmata archaeon]|nr:DUF504 domain-containing protein [Euryarchaeota archaeon]RLF66825.1 MAG: DUF504 domain-containing protein [Thermoplasmata archaeon]
MKNPKTARDTLLKIFWVMGSLSDVIIEILHRGAPGDVKRIRGEDIRRVGKHWLETYSSSDIPYHRVLRIYYKGKLVFSRLKDDIVVDINELLRKDSEDP